MLSPEARLCFNGMNPPSHIFQVLREEILRAGHNVERLRAKLPVTNLEILIADADQPPIVAFEHL
jgi:hypothetical protein